MGVDNLLKGILFTFCCFERKKEQQASNEDDWSLFHEVNSKVRTKVVYCFGICKTLCEIRAGFKQAITALVLN